MLRGLGKGVDLCRQDKITLRQAIDLMSPDGDFDFAPAKTDIGMVVFLLRNFCDTVYQIERRTEVSQLELFPKMMIINHFPTS